MGDGLHIVGLGGVLLVGARGGVGLLDGMDTGLAVVRVLGVGDRARARTEMRCDALRCCQVNCMAVRRSTCMGVGVYEMSSGAVPGEGAADSCALIDRCARGQRFRGGAGLSLRDGRVEGCRRGGRILNDSCLDRRTRYRC